jgi:hypothetical protein
VRKPLPGSHPPRWRATRAPGASARSHGRGEGRGSMRTADPMAQPVRPLDVPCEHREEAHRRHEDRRCGNGRPRECSRTRRELGRVDEAEGDEREQEQDAGVGVPRDSQPTTDGVREVGVVAQVCMRSWSRHRERRWARARAGCRRVGACRLTWVPSSATACGWSSRTRSSSAAFALASTCSTLLQPGITQVTAGCCRHHASAHVAMSTPRAPPRGGSLGLLELAPYARPIVP